MTVSDSSEGVHCWPISHYLPMNNYLKGWFFTALRNITRALYAIHNAAHHIVVQIQPCFVLHSTLVEN